MRATRPATRPITLFELEASELAAPGYGVAEEEPDEGVLEDPPV